jgi:hypothetical protein
VRFWGEMIGKAWTKLADGNAGPRMDSAKQCRICLKMNAGLGIRRWYFGVNDSRSQMLLWIALVLVRKVRGCRNFEFSLPVVAPAVTLFPPLL